MSDGITDGTYQSKIPEINLKRTTDHKNVYADTAIYQVMATFGTKTVQIFEADNKERAQSFIDSIISNGYLKTLNPTLKIVYVNHSIIEGMKNVKMEGFDNPAEGVVDFVVLAKVKRSDIFKENKKCRNG